MLGLAGICHFYLRSYEPSIPSILILRKEAWKTNASAVHIGRTCYTSELRNSIVENYFENQPKAETDKAG